MAHKFVTVADYVDVTLDPVKGAQFSADSLTERDGYRTIDQMVNELTMYGERFADWQKAAYPPDVESALPYNPWLDPFQAVEQQRMINERYLEFQRVRAEERKAKEAAAKQAADIGEATREEIHAENVRLRSQIAALAAANASPGTGNATVTPASGAKPS